MNKIESCLANLENGNLKDAKRQATRIDGPAIYRACRDRGDEMGVAAVTAAYLKGTIDFEAYCQATAPAKH
jgi:hypothetical protein